MSSTDNLIKTLADTLHQMESKKPGPYDTEAEVRRIEGNTAWVHIPGGVDETPVQLTSNAKKGDVVKVRVSGGQAWLYGNQTAPPTDDTKAIAAEKKAVVADENATDAVFSANLAKEAADSAQESAAAAKAITDEIEGYAETVEKTVTQILTDGEEAGEAAASAKESAKTALHGLSTVENVVDTLNWITAHGTMESQAGEVFDANKVYFIVDPNGDYVVQNVHYSIVTEPHASQIANYYCLVLDESIQNYIATHVMVDSEGLWLIPDDTQGSNKVLIAVGGTGHTYEDAGTYILDGSDNVLASFGANGINIGLYADINDTKAVITSGGFDLIKVTGTSGNTIVSEKQVAHLSDQYTTIGSRAIASTIGNQSIVIGMVCEASGYRSVAEGSGTVASGEASHAEGANSIASEYASHAEGQSTRASAPEAHAEGNHTLAIGYQSHAQNEGTVAQGYRQTAIGSYNIAQGWAAELHNTDHAFIIGNGTADDARSNALTVDWRGNVDIASGAAYSIGGVAIVDHVIEQGTSDGWSYRKWSSGRIEAEKDITTGSSWSTIGSPAIAHNTTAITPPTNMTVTGGYANLKTTSGYIVGAQIQIGTGINLEVHRLATSSASFTFHVTLIGTYS